MCVLGFDAWISVQDILKNAIISCGKTVDFILKKVYYIN
jgi:hypothetical protein